MRTATSTVQAVRLFLSDTGESILVYHYYDGNNNGDPALGLNVLGWTADNWPYVQ